MAEVDGKQRHRREIRNTRKILVAKPKGKKRRSRSGRLVSFSSGM
jgi:hypothetical protein